MKKIILILILVTCICPLNCSYTYADNLDSFMKQFQAEQEKLRELRLNGATKEEISAQATKVKILRTKVANLQAQIGQ